MSPTYPERRLRQGDRHGRLPAAGAVVDGGGEVWRYYRFQTVLDIGKDDMDDASRANIAALKIKARNIMSESEFALEILCARLVE